MRFLSIFLNIVASCCTGVVIILFIKCFGAQTLSEETPILFTLIILLSLMALILIRASKHVCRSEIKRGKKDEEV